MLIKELQRMIDYHPGSNVLELVYIAIEYKFPYRKPTNGFKKGNSFRLTNEDIANALKHYNDHHCKRVSENESQDHPL